MSQVSETRSKNYAIIVRTLTYVAPQCDPRGLLPTALRESSFFHHADSKGTSDYKKAKSSYYRLKDSVYKNNPFVKDKNIWFCSRGLFQFLVPLHLMRWDRNADPRIFWHPVVATIMAARLFNCHMSNGAQNLCDMRSGWAGGFKFWEKDPNYSARCRKLKNNLKTLGLPQSLADKHPKDFGYQIFGTSPKYWDMDVANKISEEMNIPGPQNMEDYPELYDFGKDYDLSPSHVFASSSVIALVSASYMLQEWRANA